MHVLFGCFAEGNAVEQSHFKGRSLFLVPHLSPCAGAVAGAAEATGEVIAVCSAEVGHLSEGRYEDFGLGDSPAPYTSSVTTGSFFLCQ